MVAAVDHVEDDAGDQPDAQHEHRDHDGPAVGPLEPFQARQAEAAERRAACASAARPGRGTSVRRQSRPARRPWPAGSTAPWIMPQTCEAGSRANGFGSANQAAVAIRPKHQRQQEQAEVRRRMVADQVEVDDHQHPGGQQVPVVAARQRRAARVDRPVVEEGRMGHQPGPGEPQHDRAADPAAEHQPRDFQGQRDRVAGGETEDAERRRDMEMPLGAGGRFPNGSQFQPHWTYWALPLPADSLRGRACCTSSACLGSHSSRDICVSAPPQRALVAPVAAASRRR